MPKKDKKNINKILSKNPFLVIGVTLIVLLGSYFGYQKYLDWQNKQLIEGMAEDFPALIAGVEEAVDYPLEISSECLQTQEKFSDGVSLCGLTVGLNEEESSLVSFAKTVKYLENNQERFTKSEEFDNKEGYNYIYNNENACQFAYSRRFYIGCAFGIRDANKPLAAELFNEELLNQKKNEALNR